MTNQSPASGESHLRVNWFPGSASVQGGIAVAFGAAFWGMFWIPLRYLDEHGVTGLWAVALVMGVLIIPATIALLLTGKLHTLGSFNTWFVGFAMGLSTVLYFTGVIITDVIRVVFLFYLLPVWATLSARLLYNEPITHSRMLVIALALIGMWLLLGGGSGLPIPSNIGDWCGLLAGFCWGVSLTLIRGKDDVDAGGMVLTTAVGATIIALGVASVLLVSSNTELGSVPPIDSLWAVLVPALGFSLLLLYPSLIGQIWGAQRIASPTAALLTMTEILVATVSAYLLIGTELNTISMLGALIILIAVSTDIALKFNQPEPA